MLHLLGMEVGRRTDDHQEPDQQPDVPTCRHNRYLLLYGWQSQKSMVEQLRLRRLRLDFGE